jgi:hypothetical protein
MTSIKWKSAEILKVFGTTIREGTFTGGKATSGGVITEDSPTTFTPQKIAKIYENIHTHVPIYMGHSTDVTRKPVGYAYKFGVTDTLDDIKYNGFIFDPVAAQKIATEGWDKVSPEMEMTEDDSRLIAITFVPNPAISGTDADIDRVVFSKETTAPGDGKMTETNVPEGAIEMGKADIDTPIPQVAPQIKPTEPTHKAADSKDKDSDYATLTAQLEDYKAKLEQQSTKTESLLNDKYEAIANDMKSLGIEDPSAIVRGLPTEQKIAVLSKMRESIAKNKPLASPTTSTTKIEDQSKSVEKALEEVLNELGVSKEDYAKISGK